MGGPFLLQPNTKSGNSRVKAVRESLPQAAHVFDRFHVIKLMNAKLTELRRDLYREAGWTG